MCLSKHSRPTSSLRSFTSPLQNHAYLGHPSLLRCLGGCPLRKEASAGDPSPTDLDIWWLYSGPRGQTVLSPWIGLPEKIGAGLKGVSIQGTLPGCFYPSPAQPWDSNLLWFQESDSIPGQGGQRLYTRHGVSFLLFLFNLMPMLCWRMGQWVLCLSSVYSGLIQSFLFFQHRGYWTRQSDVLYGEHQAHRKEKILVNDLIQIQISVHI